MNWLRRLAGSASPSPAARVVWPDRDHDPSPTHLPAACSTCGRTDLPMAGDWNPPVCLECDAAINFDALMEADDS